MATTRFTKSLLQQATKHNIARGGFTNFIKNASLYRGSGSGAPGPQWGPGSERLVRKSFQPFVAWQTKGSR